MMPDVEEDAEPELTTVNGAAGIMDEDGDAEPEPDSSPLVHSLAVRSTHDKNYPTIITELQALIHVSTGFAAKRLVFTGELTAKQIAEALLNVAGW